MRTAALVLLVACLGLQSAVISSGFQAQHGRRQMPSNSTQSPAQSPTTVVGSSPDAEVPDPMERERRAKYNSERQAQAMADARRLAEVSRELLDELEHADGQTLSATTFKKADEIIKLAKSVKDKMRPSS
jgi:hypothetical protein